jgi:hypothetical protein
MSHRARRAATTIAAVASIALLPACHHDADETSTEANAHGFVPPTPLPPKPIAGQTPLTSLDAYLGHDPHEPVDGVEFFDRTDVSTALVAAVKDERVRKEFREGTGPARPIFARGERIAAWGCEGQDCANHNWTFFLDRNNSKGEACFHDAATMGATSHWYAGGEKPVVRKGDCPPG